MVFHIDLIDLVLKLFENTHYVWVKLGMLQYTQVNMVIQRLQKNLACSEI